MSKRLILVRHAHRNKTYGRAADNGLSSKGQAQAEAAKKLFESRFAKRRPHIVCSPKLRCVETVLPLIEGKTTRIHVLPLLNEQQPKESEKKFLERVGQFCSWFRKEAPALVIACSHGDFFPWVVAEFLGAPLELAKGGWCEIVLEGREARLELWVENPGELIESFAPKHEHSTPSKDIVSWTL